MEIFGKIWQDEKFWLIEFPLLNAMTQGETQAEALTMAQDLIQEMLISYFPKALQGSLLVTINLHHHGVVGVATTNDSLMYALALRRQREVSGSTIREAAQRLGSTSPNAYGQYERGKKRISLEKYGKLLSAANPQQHALLGTACSG
jgi:hypothetical protein